MPKKKKSKRVLKKPGQKLGPVITARAKKLIKVRLFSDYAIAEHLSKKGMPVTHVTIFHIRRSMGFSALPKRMTFFRVPLSKGLSN